ncbi:peptidylprolyl isomerase [Catalinimonas niigatensis]|uniref:peptidylprolyl isomerase n=1 Tax=Catalinimonas niigatensis TaxID=1397264 RepID=UPI0026656A98|nr:peptidylprolyl isomerase [Catalinimonas niigatensis]WPP51043.1 peptidylprolyl isomerase [Catalinimonas niigatensis]
MDAIHTTKYLLHRLVITSIISFCLFSCATHKKVAELNTLPPVDLSKAALFTYGQDSMIADDFQFVFFKNNEDSVKALENAALEASINDYLKLYINFKLKVKAAYDAGKHQDPAFIQEFEKYRDQLAKPYMVESRMNEKMVVEAYERLREEIHASHILISMPENTSAQDTLQYFLKADSLRRLAINGKSFAMLAEKHSDDPSAAQNGGNLGYFSSMQMVYPFENAAYQTEVGNISEPVRTNFGYHIIKVLDRRPAQGRVKVAHIMIRHQEGEPQDETSKTYKQALKLYEELQKGTDWNELTERFSEDLSTRSNGGELPYFSTGGMLNSFEDAAFALKEAGEISKPVKTQYGWHIIKLIDRKGLEPLEMLRPLIERKVERNFQQKEMRQEMVAMLKEENRYIANEPMISKSLFYMSSGPELAKPNDMGVLFSISDTVYTFSALLTFLDKNKITLPVDSVRAKKLYQQFEGEQILLYEESHLTDKYPKYSRLVQEYKEGILLFDIMEEKVWVKASADEQGLKNYYQTHKDKYHWNKRVDATILDAKDQQKLDKAIKLLATKPISKSLIEGIEVQLNTDSPLNLQIHKDIYEEGSSRTEAEKVIDQVAWKVGTYDLNYQGRFYHVIVHEVIPPKDKSFDEVKGLVTSDYQDELEKAWIAELHEKYPVTVNELILKQLIQKIQNTNE